MSQNHQISYIEPDSGVGLGEPRNDTVASPLRPKSVVVEQSHHPQWGHIITYIKPIYDISIGPFIGIS